jgi:ubiquinone/menaquinone biosynthesis C-methylase UbiE
MTREAQEIFRSLGLKDQSDFLTCDALDIKLPDNVFDITTSIGLLEHFEEPAVVIKEQMRVLKEGGIFTAYVVPEKWTMTALFEPINQILKTWASALSLSGGQPAKTPLFRTKYDSAYYTNVMKKLGLCDIASSGVYPYPAISYSPEFPFSLMPPDFEKALVKVFQGLERMRRSQNSKVHPWACDEAIAQGFFIWGRKPPCYRQEV